MFLCRGGKRGVRGWILGGQGVFVICSPISCHFWKRRGQKSQCICQCVGGGRADGSKATGAMGRKVCVVDIFSFWEKSLCICAFVAGRGGCEVSAWGDLRGTFNAYNTQPLKFLGQGGERKGPPSPQEGRAKHMPWSYTSARWSRWLKACPGEKKWSIFSNHTHKKNLRGQQLCCYLRHAVPKNKGLKHSRPLAVQDTWEEEREGKKGINPFHMEQIRKVHNADNYW